MKLDKRSYDLDPVTYYGRDRVGWRFHEFLRDAARGYLIALGGFLSGVVFTLWMLR